MRALRALTGAIDPGYPPRAIAFGIARRHVRKSREQMNDLAPSPKPTPALAAWSHAMAWIALAAWAATAAGLVAASVRSLRTQWQTAGAEAGHGLSCSSEMSRLV
jgi:hypothetical protein